MNINIDLKKRKINYKNEKIFLNGLNNFSKIGLLPNKKSMISLIAPTIESPNSQINVGFQVLLLSDILDSSK